jgi:hypothetical protein
MRSSAVVAFVLVVVVFVRRRRPTTGTTSHRRPSWQSSRRWVPPPPSSTTSLGSASGILTYGARTFMSNWTSYGLIPLVEGFVGWFTNSLAGQMIFYPIKWRGLPLFRIEGERTVGPNRLAGDAVHRQGQPIALATMALAGSSWRQSCHSWYTCVQVRPDIKHIRLGQPLPGPRTGPSLSFHNVGLTIASVEVWRTSFFRTSGDGPYFCLSSPPGHLPEHLRRLPRPYEG